MKKKNEIVLLNSEGPVVSVKKDDTDTFVLYNSDDEIIEILNQKEFIDVVYNGRPIIVDGKDTVYKNTPLGMRANRGELTRFVYGEGVKTHFVEFDKTDGQWLSPVPSEREWQIKALETIFPGYPNASPRWQYFNGLLHIALKNVEGGDEILGLIDDLNK